MRAPALLGAALLVIAQGEPLTSVGARVVTVFAAASLTESFGELGRRFERSHEGISVRFNFAGSQQLALQLQEGAPADVFASADQRWMDSTVVRGLVAAPRLFAGNRLVIVVPKGNPAQIHRVQDLARPGVKVVLAAEAVPAGRYSREVLRKLASAPGFPPDFARRVLGNVVSEEENVRSVAAKVQLGEADAGMVYRSDVGSTSARAISLLEIPDEYNAFAAYPIAVLVRTREPAAARGFVELVLSADGQAVLRRHGFVPASGRP